MHGRGDDDDGSWTATSLDREGLLLTRGAQKGRFEVNHQNERGKRMSNVLATRMDPYPLQLYIAAKQPVTASVHVVVPKHK